MQIQIELAENGPAMWFLGEPKNLIVSLNFANPGPVEIDFDILGQADQDRIVTGIQYGIIKANVSIDELKRKAPPEAPKLKETLIAKKLEVETLRKERDEKLEERCRYLLEKNLKCVKSAIAGKQELRFIR